MMIDMAADPEFAFWSKHGIAPALALIPDKSETLVFRSCRDSDFSTHPHATIHINGDGWNCEFQTGRDSEGGHIKTSCIAWLIDDFYSALVESHKIAKNNGMRLAVGDLVRLDHEWFDRATEACWMSGCNPTLNVDFENAVKPMPDYAHQIVENGAPLGGHVHILKHINDPKSFVRFATIVAVLPMAAWGWDGDRMKRFKLLGVGNYRLPKHGGLELKDFGGGVLQTMVHASAQFGLVRSAVSAWMKPDRPLVRRVFESIKYDQVRDMLLNGSDNMFETCDKVIDIMSHECLDEGSPFFLPDAFKFLIRNPSILPSDPVLGWSLESGEDRSHDKGYLSQISRILGIQSLDYAGQYPYVQCDEKLCREMFAKWKESNNE